MVYDRKSPSEQQPIRKKEVTLEEELDGGEVQTRTHRGI
jgi:hypothetical protein